MQDEAVNSWYLVGDLDRCERLPQFSKLYAELPVHPCSFCQCSLVGSSVLPRAHRNRCRRAKLPDLGQIDANRRTTQGQIWGVVKAKKLSPLKGCSRIDFSIAITKLSAVLLRVLPTLERVKTTRFDKRSLLRNADTKAVFLGPKGLVDNSLVSPAPSISRSRHANLGDGNEKAPPVLRTLSPARIFPRYCLIVASYSHQLFPYRFPIRRALC